MQASFSNATDSNAMALQYIFYMLLSISLQPSSSKVQTPPSPPTNAGAKHHRRGSKVTVASGSKVAVPR
ncbi:hypothetical protein HN873_005517, partial [Arachis hypogaea]